MAETGQYRDDHSGILESCISKAAGYAVEVNGSGRTDAGVHARGQTASVVLHGKAEDGFFTEKVNKLLPPDIRIREAGLEKMGFMRERVL